MLRLLKKKLGILLSQVTGSILLKMMAATDSGLPGPDRNSSRPPMEIHGFAAEIHGATGGTLKRELVRNTCSSSSGENNRPKAVETTTADGMGMTDTTQPEMSTNELQPVHLPSGTALPPCARGPLLLKNLSDGPWENLKYLASDESWLDDPRNGERLLALMDTKELYGEEERESMLAACARLTFHLKRQKAESAKGFMTRWDTAERKVRDHGVQLPNEYLAFLMVHALQLSSDQIKDLKAWLSARDGLGLIEPWRG